MIKILYIIFLSLIVANCSFKNVVKHHGVPFLEKKQATLLVNEANKNEYCPIITGVNCLDQIRTLENLNEIISMISKKYKDMKYYMTLTEGDDKYIIRLNNDDKICFLIEEV